MNSVIAYVPVLHRGYVEFFEKYGGRLYILDCHLVEEVDYLERDIRSLPPRSMAPAVQALGIFESVAVLDTNSVEALLPEIERPVLPDEDTSRCFARRYLAHLDVSFDSIFLRWNRGNVTSLLPVSAERTLPFTELDRELMGRAYSEARKSPDWWRQVGAVAVKDDSLLYVAYNKHLPSEHSAYVNGDPRTPFRPGERTDLSLALHAERSIISLAAREGVSLDGTSVYVTTFPCPECARQLAASGVKRVYFTEGYSLLGAAEILKSFGVAMIRVDMQAKTP